MEMDSFNPGELANRKTGRPIASTKVAILEIQEVAGIESAHRKILVTSCQEQPSAYPSGRMLANRESGVDVRWHKAPEDCSQPVLNQSRLGSDCRR